MSSAKPQDEEQTRKIDVLGPQKTGREAPDWIVTSDEAPVSDRLPPEILDIIFKHYVASRGPWGKEAALRPPASPNPLLLPSPFLLCQVCKSWKDMVFNNPVIWADIHINVVEPIYCRLDPTVQLTASMVNGTHASVIKSWIARVGTSPLSLSIHIHRKRRQPLQQGTSNSTIDISLPSLLPPAVLENVRYFGFRGDAWTTGLGTLTFPAIQSVVVHSDEFARWANRYGRPAADFPAFPALRKATLTGLMHPFSSLRPSPRIPWKQLTHLYLGKQVAYAKVLMVLKTATALQQGCFDIKSSPPAAHTIAALRRESNDFLPNLRDLTFMRNSPFDTSFLEHGGISWPNLVCLRLCTEDRISWGRAFIQSFGSLTSLSLAAPKTTEFRTSVAPILNACPLLTSLSLALQLERYEPLFEFMVFNPSKPHLMRLADLKVSWGAGNPVLQDPTSFPYAQLYKMIVSRSDVGRNHKEYQDGFTAAPVAGGPWLKKFTLWLSEGPVSDSVAKTIRRDLMDLESGDMKILVLWKQPRKAVWNEIVLDHWDYALGPMLASEDGLV